MILITVEFQYFGLFFTRFKRRQRIQSGIDNSFKQPDLMVSIRKITAENKYSEHSNYWVDLRRGWVAASLASRSTLHNPNKMINYQSFVQIFLLAGSRTFQYPLVCNFKQAFIYICRKISKIIYMWTCTYVCECVCVCVVFLSLFFRIWKPA